MSSVFRKKSRAFIVLILLMGSIIGTLLGKLIALLLPNQSIVKQFFLVSSHWGIERFTFDAGLFKFTLGFSLDFNIVGLIGVAFAAYLLKYYL